MNNTFTMKHNFIFSLQALLLLTVITFFAVDSAKAQLERKRAVPSGPEELTFMAPRSINIYTVEPISAGELHYSIMHTFGEVEAGIQNLWGIDYGANVRLSFEYAPTNRVSLAFARTSEDKVVDLSGRLHLMKQQRDGSVPVSITLSGGFGLTTADYSYLQNNYSLSDRFQNHAMVHIARKFSQELSLQVSPGFAYFSRVGTELSVASPVENFYAGVAFSGRYRVASRMALTFQAVPRFYGDESDVVLGAGLDIETGGHVFQLYMVTSNALQDAYVLSGKNGGIKDGAFRLGFNVNRVFSVKR